MVRLGINRGVFDGVTPTTGEMVRHDREGRAEVMASGDRLPQPWLAPVDPVTNGDYYRTVRATFTEIACRDEHTARGLMRQWRKRFASRPNGPAKDAVHAAFAEARAGEAPCSGLKAIPDEEWQRFITSGR